MAPKPTFIYFPGDDGLGVVDVSMLIRNIGITVNMNYGCDVSLSMGWAHAPNLFTRAFRNNLYSNAGQTDHFDIQKLKDEIKRGFPILLSGCERQLGD